MLYSVPVTHNPSLVLTPETFKLHGVAKRGDQPDNY
jgi:hypothetical protein